MRLLARLLVPFLAILLAQWLFPQQIGVGSLLAAAVFALALALLNAFVRPIVALFALPITCLTLGLFHFVLNAIFFAFAAGLTSRFVPGPEGVTVQGFFGAFLGALVVSVVGLLLSMLVH